jgi:UDP-2,3-diacylglucosamine pyrophosphatase LpxH
MIYKTIFVSDLHLGTRNSQAEAFLEFLKNNDFETLYLVGDIIDISALKRNFYWNETFNTVLQKILRFARKDKKIVYIIGNHDIALEFFMKEHFGNIFLKERTVHNTVSGVKCLVMHGHQFDGVIKEIAWLYWLGDTMYDFALFLNRISNFFRSLFGMSRWSLSLYLKTKVKNVIQFINNFEQLVIHELRNSQPDATVVITGHVHICADKDISGIRYLNCGCWTEFCSVVVEHLDGRLELLKLSGFEEKK